MKKALCFQSKIVIGGAILALSALLSCSGSSQVKEQVMAETPENQLIILSREQFTEAGMLIESLRDTLFSHYVTANGYVGVKPSDKASVSSLMGGSVVAILIEPGQQVNKGQALIRMQHPDFFELQKSYLETKAAYGNAKVVYERQKMLAKENINAAREFQQSETEYLMLGASLASLEKKLQMLQINTAKLEASSLSSTFDLISPLQGYVSSVLVNTGSWLNAENAAVELINTNQQLLYLSVFEKDIIHIRTGLHVTASLPDHPDLQLEAVISTIGKQIDPQKRTVEVMALIEKQGDAKLVYGMFVGTRILYENYPVHCLPEEAIVNVDNQNFVLVVRSETSESIECERVQIKTGESMNKLTEVLSSQGFDNKTRFIVKGGFQLLL